ncbi:hypothetical protein ALC53_07440 [Atta colombica]|uniref:Uncharacterized protein n=1 Tax=Atta colombica TaxID=520822 RepID=A0A151I308_9HYME|nr:hypothetical protein ALC53_07440 [Atta colombica]
MFRLGPARSTKPQRAGVQPIFLHAGLGGKSAHLPLLAWCAGLGPACSQVPREKSRATTSTSPEIKSPGTLHKDVGGAGTKVSEKTVGGVGTATLTTLSSINNASNTGRNKNNPVSHEVSYNTIVGWDESKRSSRIDRSWMIRHPGARR